MCSTILNSHVANSIFGNSALLSLSIKITDSYVSQVTREIRLSSISFEQWITLSLINSGNAQHPSQLAQTTGLSSPQITRIIDDLEKKDLVLRRVDMQDRRKFNLEVSERGYAIFDRVNRKLSLSSVIDESSLTNNEKEIYKLIGTDSKKF